MLSWKDVSEIVSGMILAGKLSENVVRPELFCAPYDDIIRAYKGGTREPEKLMQMVGFAPLQAIIEAEKEVHESRADWIKLLETSHSYYQAGSDLERLSRSLKRGEPIDFSLLTDIASKAQVGNAEVFSPLSSIERTDIPFIPTGWAVWDDHTGGLPEIGLIVVSGPPGVGKTTWAARLSTKFAQHHTDKVVAVFSIEMTKEQYAMRSDEVEKMDKSIEDRIMINDETLPVDDVVARAATIKNLGLVMIDFADLMIQGETSESTMAHIYRTLMLAAKKLHCPIVLLSQLSRNYSGGLPRPSHVRYTSLAEALAYMIVMLYNPSNDWTEQENYGDGGEPPLPIKPGTAYMILWKIRGGFRIHKDDWPGAIMTTFSGSNGWGSDKSKWFSLMKDGSESKTREKRYRK